MPLKVLVTGKNEEIARDISTHLVTDRGCQVIRCAPSREALIDKIPIELPQVVIICLSYEKALSVGIYDVLAGSAGPGGISVIVVANAPDKKAFMNHTRIERMFFLARPVSILALYERMNAIEAELEKYSSKNEGSTEFVNPKAAARNQKKHILVIDDDAQQLMQIKDHLSDFYDVTLVSSGEAAFKFLSKKRTNLILLDYMMPDMNGPQVYEQIQKTPSLWGIPVIFLTGVNEKSTVLKTLTELKPQGYIVKPAKKSALIAKILDVLDSVPERESNEDLSEDDIYDEADTETEGSAEEEFEEIDPSDLKGSFF